MTQKQHLSITQLNMLSKCGEQYRQRYVLGIKIPPGVSFVVGRAVDQSVTQNLTQRLQGKELLPDEAVLDIAAESFNAEWDGSDVSLTIEENKLGVKVVKGQALDKSVRLAGLHAKDMAPFIQPTHLQRKLEVELPGFPLDLIGYLDIQEGNKSIRDTKTSGKTPASDVAHRDDQLTVYAMMAKVIDGAIPEILCLDYLIDIKQPVAKTFSTTRDTNDFDPILRRIETACLALEKGVFVPANEGVWWCDPKWCGYWNTCVYTKKSRRS